MVVVGQLTTDAVSAAAVQAAAVTAVSLAGHVLLAGLERWLHLSTQAARLRFP